MYMSVSLRKRGGAHVSVGLKEGRAYVSVSLRKRGVTYVSQSK